MLSELTRRQRLLNRIYGDWQQFVKQEIGSGRTLEQIADWFRQHDGIDVGAPTLSRWLRVERRRAKEEAAA